MTGPLAELPEGLLHTLSAVIPDFTLVGSFARDHRVHTIAGLPRVAQTVDVDIAIQAPSMTDYRTQLRTFNGPHGSGIAFLIDGIQVDVIPYGPQIAPQGRLGAKATLYSDDGYQFGHLTNSVTWSNASRRSTFFARLLPRVDIISPSVDDLTSAFRDPREPSLDLAREYAEWLTYSAGDRRRHGHRRTPWRHTAFGA